MKIPNILSVISNHAFLFLIVIGTYLLFVFIGLLLHKKLPNVLTTFMNISDAQKTKQVEKMFSQYREPVKNGDWRAISKCAMIVFGLNTLGMIQNTVLSALLIPLILQMGFVGINQGVAFSETKGSSLTSLLAYYFVGGLEWISYPLANFAGILFTTSIISSLINHQELAIMTRITEVAAILMPVIVILFFQAILELLYVRKVLCVGGTAIPLKPY